MHFPPTTNAAGWQIRDPWVWVLGMFLFGVFFAIMLCVLNEDRIIQSKFKYLNTVAGKMQLKVALWTHNCSSIHQQIMPPFFQVHICFGKYVLFVCQIQSCGLCVLIHILNELYLQFSVETDMTYGGKMKKRPLTGTKSGILLVVCISTTGQQHRPQVNFVMNQLSQKCSLTATQSTYKSLLTWSTQKEHRGFLLRN